MRDRHDEFVAAGANLVAIGSSSPRSTAAFASKRRVPFTLLSDRERRSYKALELKTGALGELVGPRVWKPALRALKRGAVQGVTDGSTRQLGGAMVVLPGGEVTLIHRAEDAADNASVDDLLQALVVSAQEP